MGGSKKKWASLLWEAWENFGLGKIFRSGPTGQDFWRPPLSNYSKQMVGTPTSRFGEKSMFECLSVLKTRRRYVNSGRLLADCILQHTGSKRSDPIREMHVLTFFFCVFKPEEGTRILVVSWQTQLCNMPL